MDDKTRNKWAQAVPIVSVILGIIGVLSLNPSIDDSLPWNMEMAVGVLMLFGIPPMILGVITIRSVPYEQSRLGIIGLILGFVTSMAMVVIMMTL